MHTTIEMDIRVIPEFFKLDHDMRLDDGSKHPSCHLSDFLGDRPIANSTKVQKDLERLAKQLKKNMPVVFPKIMLSCVPLQIYGYGNYVNYDGHTDPNRYPRYQITYLHLEGDVFARAFVIIDTEYKGLMYIVPWGGEHYWSPRLTHRQKDRVSNLACRLETRLYRTERDYKTLLCNFLRINTEVGGWYRRAKPLLTEILNSQPLTTRDLVMSWTVNPTSNIETKLMNNPTVSSRNTLVKNIRLIFEEERRWVRYIKGHEPITEEGVVNVAEIIFALGSGEPLPEINPDVARAASAFGELLDVYKKSSTRYPFEVIRPVEGDYVIVAIKRPGSTTYRIEESMDWVDNETMCQLATLSSMRSDGEIAQVGAVKSYDNGLISQVFTCSIDKEVVDARYRSQES